MKQALALLYIFIISLCFQITPSVAKVEKNKIYLLVSFKEKTETKLNSTLKKLNKRFYKELSNEGELITYKNVSAFNLYSILKDSATKAVFWLSHGGQLNSYGVPKNIIRDLHKNEVQDIFSLAHNRIEFMGIISCDSQYALTNKNTEQFNTWVSTKKTTPYSGLKKAIKSYKRNYMHSNISMKNNSRYDIALERVPKKNSFRKPIRIKINGKTVGYNIYSPRSTYQVIRALKNNRDINKIQLAVDKENGMEFINSTGFGRVKLYNYRNEWKPLLKKDGTPLRGSIQTFKTSNFKY